MGFRELIYVVSNHIQPVRGGSPVYRRKTLLETQHTAFPMGWEQEAKTNEGHQKGRVDPVLPNIYAVPAQSVW